MKRLPILPILVLTFLTGCPAEMWIPIQTVPRQRVSDAHVQYLEEAPNRPYEVIGIITPPAGEYETEAAAVADMRSIAAKHGADAIFIESQTESSGWKFDAGWRGSKGGSFKDVQYRAKAIAWK